MYGLLYKKYKQNQAAQTTQLSSAEPNEDQHLIAPLYNKTYNMGYVAGTATSMIGLGSAFVVHGSNALHNQN